MQTEKRITLDYNECLTEHGEIMLASPPESIDGLRVAIFSDIALQNGELVPTKNSLLQVQLSGTPDSLRDFGRFLIAISELPVLPRNFVSHLCPIPGGMNASDVHLIVHQQFAENPAPLVQIGDTIEIDEN